MTTNGATIVNDATTGAAHSCAATECIATPAITDPVPLCFAHVLQIVSHAMPQVIQAAAHSTADTSTTVRMLPVNTEKLLAARSHDPIVYFIRNGDRVKIGTTRNLRGRVSTLSLRPENVVLTVSGGIEVEQDLHERFADLRVGNTEWFRHAPAIAGFIKNRSAIGTSTPVSPLVRSAKGRTDSRREVVYALVTEAGAEGIGPEDLVRTIANRFPDINPPHPATIIRWLSADPRVTRPTYGRYAAASV